MGRRTRVLIWNEFVQERTDEGVRSVYPDGIHRALGEALEGEFDCRYGTLGDPEQGLSAEALASAQVLLMWAHLAHDRVEERTVDRVVGRVHDGLGLLVLHSAAQGKILRRLLGTSCDLRWREDHRHCRVWVVEPSHPIAEGLSEQFVIPVEEMYGERFDVPRPEDTILLSWFPGGEVFRSGMTWTRGRGRIFYFQPGHETYPVYYQPEVRRVISNAVGWLRYQGTDRVLRGTVHAREPLEPWEPPPG